MARDRKLVLRGYRNAREPDNELSDCDDELLIRVEPLRQSGLHIVQRDAEETLPSSSLCDGGPA